MPGHAFPSRLERALAWALLLSTAVLLALFVPAIVVGSGLGSATWWGAAAMLVMSLVVVPGALLAALTVLLSIVALVRFRSRVAGRLALWYLLVGAAILSSVGGRSGPLGAVVEALLLTGALYVSLVWVLRSPSVSSPTGRRGGSSAAGGRA